MSPKIRISRRWRPGLDQQILLLRRYRTGLAQPTKPWRVECDACNQSHFIPEPVYLRDWASCVRYVYAHCNVHRVQGLLRTSFGPLGAIGEAFKGFVQPVQRRSDYALIPGEPGPLLRQSLVEQYPIRAVEVTRIDSEPEVP